MKARAFILILAVMGVVGIAAPASAETTPERRLLVTPIRTELSVDAGSAYKGALTLKNTGKTTLTVTLEAQAFDVTNQNYDYAFKPDAPINDWVNFTQPTVTLDPEQSYVAHYLVSVPIGAEPGGKYLSLFAAAQPDTDTGITSIERVGSLLYLTVPGAITKKGELLILKSPFITTNEINWSATIRNGGTAHFRTNYEQITKTLWNTTITSNKGSALILPASVRLIQGSADHPKWLGIYKVQYTFTLGDTGTHIQTRLFVYAPLAQLGPAAAILLLLIGGIVTLARRHAKLKKAKSN